MDRHIRHGLALTLGLGFGIGLMVSAGLLALAAPGPQELTDEQIRARATALGMMNVTQMPKAPPPTEPADAPPRTLVTFSVTPGMTFDAVVPLLKAGGLTEAGDRLLQRAAERGVLEQLQVGTFTVQVDDAAKPPTADQIIDQLTGTTAP